MISIILQDHNPVYSYKGSCLISWMSEWTTGYHNGFFLVY